MHLRSLLQAALLTGLVVGTAQACSKHSADVSTAVAPRTAAHATLVSWKPRAWAPPVALRRADRSAVAAGMRVERDPVDGTLTMPQPDRFEQLVEVGERAPVSIMRMSNGRIRAQLDDRFAEFAVVRIGADGKPHWTCVHGPAGAERFLQSTVVPAPAPGTKWEDQ